MATDENRALEVHLIGRLLDYKMVDSNTARLVMLVHRNVSDHEMYIHG